MPDALSPHDFAALKLARTSGIGPVNYHKLVAKYGSAAEALNHMPTRSGKPLTPPSDAALQQEITQTRRAGAQFIFHHAANYPELLRHTPDAPPVLIAKGDANLLTQRQVAIVGNRNMSAAGENFTRTLAATLSDHNLIITSGGARGVDTVAHSAALSVGAPTIAVIAGGIDHIYPPENGNLFDAIAASGCIVTEAPIGEKVTNRHFPRRNRIIAGLTLATVVTEASRHSGSLITAQYAGEYGRDVFAIPGGPTDPRAAGPNHLLQQGAILALSAEDILNTITQDPSLVLAAAPTKTHYYIREEQASLDLMDIPSDLPTEQPHLTEENAPQTLSAVDEILNALSSTPTSQDVLLRTVNLPERDALTTLSELELLGDITREGSFWRLA